MTNTAPTGGVIEVKHDKNKRTEREKTRTWLIVGAEKRQEAVSCITSGLVTAFVRFLSRANLHRQPQMDHPHLRHLMPEPVCRCACERGRQTVVVIYVLYEVYQGVWARMHSIMLVMCLRWSRSLCSSSTCDVCLENDVCAQNACVAAWRSDSGLDLVPHGDTQSLLQPKVFVCEQNTEQKTEFTHKPLSVWNMLLQVILLD